jgi:hypothetical protein
VGAHEEQAGELALRPGRGLEAHGVEPGHLAEDLLELPLELERALRRVVVDQGMKVAESWKPREALVDAGCTLSCRSEGRPVSMPKFLVEAR